MKFAILSLMLSISSLYAQINVGPALNNLNSRVTVLENKTISVNDLLAMGFITNEEDRVALAALSGYSNLQFNVNQSFSSNLLYLTLISTNHFANGDIHITTVERQFWNNKIGQSNLDAVVYSINTNLLTKPSFSEVSNIVNNTISPLTNSPENRIWTDSLNPTNYATISNGIVTEWNIINGWNIDIPAPLLNSSGNTVQGITNFNSNAPYPMEPGYYSGLFVENNFTVYSSDPLPIVWYSYLPPGETNIALAPDS